MSCEIAKNYNQYEKWALDTISKAVTESANNPKPKNKKGGAKPTTNVAWNTASSGMSGASTIAAVSPSTPDGCEWLNGSLQCTVAAEAGQVNALSTAYKPSQVSDVDKIIFWSLGENDRIAAIKDRIKYAMNQPECASAFQNVGATPIHEQITNLTIVTQGIFTELHYDKNWTRKSDVGVEMRDSYRKNRTAFDHSWPGIYGNTGHRFIGIADRAFGNEEHLSVVVIHSLVHSGGKEGKVERSLTYVILNVTPHDLRYLGQAYKDILKHCTREKGSKMLWGQ
jgi:hypothetical protein